MEKHEKVAEKRSEHEKRHQTERCNQPEGRDKTERCDLPDKTQLERRSQMERRNQMTEHLSKHSQIEGRDQQTRKEGQTERLDKSSNSSLIVSPVARVKRSKRIKRIKPSAASKSIYNREPKTETSSTYNCIKSRKEQNNSFDLTPNHSEPEIKKSTERSKRQASPGNNKMAKESSSADAKKTPRQHTSRTPSEEFIQQPTEFEEMVQTRPMIVHQPQNTRIIKSIETARRDYSLDPANSKKKKKPKDDKN